MKKIISLLSVCFIFSISAEAHSMAYDFSTMSGTDIFFEYLKLGFQHILPLGFDHILFVIGIFLLKPDLRTVLLQISCFTISHSITLAMAMNGLIVPPSGIIEPLIALSIVFIGIENIFFKELKWWRFIIVFIFGLIHGCGFAGVLSEIGLPEKDFLNALIAFNVGVEAGQTAVILIAIIIFQSRFADQKWYRNRVTIPVSACISLVGIYWTVERLLIN